MDVMHSRLARTGFIAQQHGLAVATGLLMRRFHRALGTAGSGGATRRLPTRHDIAALRKRFSELLARDWDNAEEGYYPKRLLFDLRVREHLRNLPAAAADLPRVLRRSRGRKFDDLPATIDRGAYPDYYLRNFHWQTDGWLSERSARLYDLGVDLLFGGSADAMRRMAVPPVITAVRGIDRPRVLDVACGTGRFVETLRAALPQAALYGVDLSPFYIEHAARRAIPGVAFSVENAEALPFKDDWFDAVTIVFLLHEMPRDARRRVLAEARRVIRPGGVVSLVDSAQTNDASDIAFFLDAFHGMYHEPYFKGYLADDLEGAIAEVGLDVVASQPAFVARLVVGQKPMS
jgi:ubiquinone/menaquinone biosynthesis C-methylase UbiE